MLTSILIPKFFRGGFHRLTQKALSLLLNERKMKKTLTLLLGISIAFAFACNPPKGDKEKAEQKREADSTSDALADKLNKELSDSGMMPADCTTVQKTEPKKKK